MRVLALLALLVVAFPVAASAHRCPVHVPMARTHSGVPYFPIVTPAVNGAAGIIGSAFGAASGILTDTGQVIIGLDPWGRPVYEDRGGW